ncbi:ESPR-type extended signal peptide-containing protein [Ursidibacter arcticus]
MNKIFRVIWNHSTQSWVAVSELAKGRVKSSTSSTEKNKPNTAVCSVATLIALAVNIAYADELSSGNRTAGITDDFNRPVIYSENGQDNYQMTGDGRTGNGGLSAVGVGSATPLVVNGVIRGVTSYGWNSKANGIVSTAYGVLAVADGKASVAVGSQAYSKGANSLAIMRNSSATGNHSYAIGAVSYAEGGGSLAIGHSTHSGGERSIAIGSTQDSVNNRNNYRDTNNTQTLGNRSIAIGATARTESGAHDAIVFGTNAKADINATNATAIGQNTQVTKADAIAVGTGAKAQEVNATAIGTGSLANSTNATAIGLNSRATQVDAIAVGTGAKASQANTTAIGFNATASDANAFAAGNNATATSKQAVAVGVNAIAGSQNTTAIGFGSNASRQDAIALGTNTKAQHQNATSIGTNANASGEASIALGRNTIAGATGAVAVGDGTRASAEKASAFGIGATVTGSNGVAVGAESNASAQNAAAFGLGATARHNNSVALGANSYTSEAGRVSNLSFNLANGTANRISAQGSSGVLGTVSVGNQDGATRQIQYVAAGRLSADSTDAVNGSQLYHVMENVGFNIQQNGTNVSRIDNNNIVNFANGDFTTSNVTGDANAVVKFNVATRDISATSDATKATAGTAPTGFTDGLAKTSQVVDAINKSGFTLKANNQAGEAITNGEEVSFNNGTNINVVRNGSNITINTNPNVTFTNVTATDINATNVTATNTKAGTLSANSATVSGTTNLNGGVTVNGTTTLNNGATISGGNLVMNNNKITGLANGTSANDAVNKSQLDVVNRTANAANVTANTNAENISKGLNFTADSGSQVNRQLGDTLQIKGRKNINTSAAGNTITVNIVDDPEFTS